jgi:hypothetical protein
MRYRARAGHFPPGAGDTEGWRYRPAVEQGFRLTVPARTGGHEGLLQASRQKQPSGT